MTEQQILAVKCAYADLIGAFQVKEQRDINLHDWDAHLLSIEDLERNFDFIEPVNLE